MSEAIWFPVFLSREYGGPWLSITDAGRNRIVTFVANYPDTEKNIQKVVDLLNDGYCQLRALQAERDAQAEHVRALQAERDAQAEQVRALQQAAIDAITPLYQALAQGARGDHDGAADALMLALEAMGIDVTPPGVRGDGTVVEAAKVGGVADE